MRLAFYRRVLALRALVSEHDVHVTREKVVHSRGGDFLFYSSLPSPKVGLPHSKTKTGSEVCELLFLHINRL